LSTCAEGWTKNMVLKEMPKLKGKQHISIFMYPIQYIIITYWIDKIKKIMKVVA
jgi:hypothetical protein